MNINDFDTFLADDGSKTHTEAWISSDESVRYEAIHCEMNFFSWL